jgi:hypothetical protein
VVNTPVKLASTIALGTGSPMANTLMVLTSVNGHSDPQISGSVIVTPQA